MSFRFSFFRLLYSLTTNHHLVTVPFTNPFITIRCPHLLAKLVIYRANDTDQRTICPEWGYSLIGYSDHVARAAVVKFTTISLGRWISGPPSATLWQEKCLCLSLLPSQSLSTVVVTISGNGRVWMSTNQQLLVPSFRPQCHWRVAALEKTTPLVVTRWTWRLSWYNLAALG